MRASTYVLHFLDRCLGVVHATRRRAVVFAVSALLAGGRLSLTALARGAPGPALVKHRIKRIDRLFGNDMLHQELPVYYAALAAFVLQQQPRPIILVDWTPAGVGSLHCALAASVPVCGRALIIYAEVYDYHQTAEQAVGIYALRMQTEETFRDLKSHRFGWSFEDARSESSDRMAVMIMLAAIAAVIAMLVDAAAEAMGFEQRYQANTIRKRRVLSLIYLGKEVMRSANPEVCSFAPHCWPLLPIAVVPT